MEKVFVYGTLKRSNQFHYALQPPDSMFLGEASTVDPYYFFDLGKFPAIVKPEPLNKDLHSPVRILGELWQTRNIKTLDYIEGHPTFYHRYMIPVITEASFPQSQMAWAYFLTLDTCQGASQILSGIWKCS